MEIMYQRTPTFKFVGLFFMILGLLYLLLWMITHFVLFFLPPIALLNFLIGVLHYFIQHRVYVVCNSDLFIIRSNLLFITRIKYNEMSHIEKNNLYFTLYYGQGKKKNTHFKFMDAKDRAEFEAYLLNLPSVSKKSI